MNRLKELRMNAGISQSTLAAKIGVVRSTIAMWETSGSQPDNEALCRLADYFHVSTDYLLGREFDPDGPPASTGGVWVPVLGQVAAGIPMEAVENIEGYEEIPRELAEQGEYFALRVKGSSMEPKISDGDVVIVRRQAECESGDLAVVLVNGGEATVKRIKLEPAGLMLIPLNPAFEPMFYSNEQVKALPVTIVGRVAELRAKF